MKVKIEVSGHHCHISRSDLDLIYGQGYQLTPIKPLSQTGQFAAKETVNVKVGEKTLANVRILGPERKNAKVEISLTDAINLGLNQPIKVSGDLEGTPGLVLIGSRGKVELKKGVIIAWRHIHCNPHEAEKLGFKDRMMVSVKCGGDKGLTFHNVIIRVDQDDKLCMHLDTDEGNAAGIIKRGEGELIS